jgi:tetratricopeptide (TPR) repeat protein
MLIEMLLVILIIGLIVAGPSFKNIWVGIAVYGGIIGGLVFAWWYSRQLSGSIADLLLGGMGGDKVKPTYGLAEKYEMEHNYEAAINQYLLAIKKDKKNPTPRLKLANLYYRLEDYDNCLRHMEEALRISKAIPLDNRCTTVNRIADIYIQHKADPNSAVRILKELADKHPATKYAAYARDRIARIKETG